MYCTHCGCALVLNFMMDQWEHTDTHSEYCTKDHEHSTPNIRGSFYSDKA